MIARPFGGRSPAIDPAAWVADDARLIGDVSIAADASIWFGCVLRGDVQPIAIGAGTNIQDGTVIHGSTGGAPVTIGAGVTVGHRAILHGCVVEDGAFVGMGATLLDGVIVEGGAMVAAGAVVTPGKRVTAGELWAGAPARPVRALRDGERTGIGASAERYVALMRAYRDAI